MLTFLSVPGPHAPADRRAEFRIACDGPRTIDVRSLDWGYRAIFVLLNTYRVRYGLQTIAQMISRWAPPSENRTDRYIRTVCERTGIPADRPLDTRDRQTMVPVAAAISFVENGVAANMTEVEKGWELFIF